MLKRIFFISLVFTIAGGFLSLSYAYQAIVLSDAELDSISAAGFDININAVLAMRQAMRGQNNISAVIAKHGNINGATINNSNKVHSSSAAPGIDQQKNVGVVVALEGNIQDAFINNINSAALTSPQDLTQSNLSIILARGNIKDSNISNVNSLTIPGGESYSFTFDSLVTHNIKHILINYSALGNQSNLEVVASLAGSIT
ncbi:MAG: hypothetical protein ABH914_02435, partial [Candidatus Omnitrophota bacterium]